MSIHKNVKVLTWLNFFTDFKLYAPVAIIYFTKVSGSYALGMSVFSVVMISAAFFEIPTGIFSDYIGRRNTVFLGAIASVSSVVLYAIGGSYGMLLFGAIFEGISRSFYSGNNDALLHDSLMDVGKSEEYHVHLGKVSAMFQFAGAGAAVLGGVIANFSFAILMWISVLPQLINVFLSFAIVEPKERQIGSSNIYSHLRESLHNFLRNRKLRVLSISSIIGYSSGEASFQFQSVFFNTLWPLWALGIARFISNACAAFSFYFAGKTINKYKEIPLLIFGNIFNRTLNFIGLLFPSVASPVLLSSTSILFGTMTVARGNLLQQEFTESQRATMGSLNSFASSLFFAVFAFGIGLFADRFGGAQALIATNIIQLTTVYFYKKLKDYETI